MVSYSTAKALNSNNHLLHLQTMFLPFHKSLPVQMRCSSSLHGLSRIFNYPPNSESVSVEKGKGSRIFLRLFMCWWWTASSHHPHHYILIKAFTNAWFTFYIFLGCFYLGFSLIHIYFEVCERMK
jgi:hypothetical protein